MENQCKIKNIIMVISGKGGVGKSTVTTLIATSFARKGCKVLILNFLLF
jgi:Mrp family chromosome partitioning ATPase